MTPDEPLKRQMSAPNFVKDGQLYLIRCFACPDAGVRGRENYAMAVAAGECAWCGWAQPEKEVVHGSTENQSG